MSVALYRAGVAAPRAEEAVTAAHALVAASALITAQGVTSAGHVYLDAYPAEDTSSGAGTVRPDRFVVVRQRLYAAPQPLESSAYVVVPVETAIYIHQDRPNRRQFLEEADARIALALRGQRPALTYGTARLGYSIETTLVPDFDERIGYEMALRGYQIVLAPI